MQPGFIHLRTHSEYSLVDSTIRVKSLVARCRELGMPAVAITDESNLFALVKFYRAAIKAGIKPIVGADLWIDNPKEADEPFRITLLCQDRDGYRNLCRLISKAYTEGQYRGQPRVQQRWVHEAADGLIAILPNFESDVGRALLNQHHNQAETLTSRWQRHFPERLYFELRRTGREQEKLLEPQALELAQKAQLPVLASNDVRFLEQDDFDAHEARVCIRASRLLADPRREKAYSDEQYLKSPEAMAELFADLPSALQNAEQIAQRCNLEIQFGDYYLPAFPDTQGESEEAFLRKVSEEGLKRRLEVHGLAEDHTEQDYLDRLEHELDVITGMRFPGYFLIVADFIRWAKRNDIPVGPGRGSGAGSVVAWALDITDLDPLKYDLLFERFLNPERVSMPDFDVDFCMERRDEVISYVADTYGRDQVSQIITYGSMAAKAVVRDVGRVLGHGYGFVDSIAKLIPMTIGITLQEAIDEVPELKQRYKEEEDTRAILDLALSLEGLARNAGKHAGGVVIAPDALTEFTPLFAEPNGESLVTQFDKDDVEAIGLVKFDFLGLRTLTIIDWAVKAINQHRNREGEEPLNINQIPLEDEKTFKLLQSCMTTSVFQLESRGMKDLIRRLQPDDFEDIVALVALFRPGPLQSGMVDDYIDRKHGRAPVRYPHPSLEPILEPTNGVILYQEQVMRIAQDLAGYTLGDADLLRRAMGKKKPAEMAKQRSIFVKGASDRGINAQMADSIFNLMETFAGYGFNKSHSAAYALLSYQTAWLKAHYPAELMAASLSSDMDNTDRVAHLVDDCRKIGLEVSPPDVNESDYMFTARAADRIRYGLGAIKGVGRGAIESIQSARHGGGKFESLDDFAQRADLAKINKRAFETLVRSGATDSLDPDENRARLLHRLPDVIQAAEQSQHDKAAGQVDLFGAPAPAEEPEQVDVAPWPDAQRLRAERETLGLYLTGHPMDQHREDLDRFTNGSLNDAIEKLGPMPEESNGDGRGKGRDRGTLMTLAGLIMAIRRRAGKGAFIAIDDGTARMEVAVFEENWQQHAEVLAKDEIIVVEGPVGHDRFSGGIRMSAKQIMTLEAAKRHFAKAVRISVDGGDDQIVQRLQDTFAPYRRGNAPVWIEYCNDEACAKFEFGEEWRVEACEELISALGNVRGVLGAGLVY